MVGLGAPAAKTESAGPGCLLASYSLNIREAVSYKACNTLKKKRFGLHPMALNSYLNSRFQYFHLSNKNNCNF